MRHLQQLVDEAKPLVSLAMSNWSVNDLVGEKPIGESHYKAIWLGVLTTLIAHKEQQQQQQQEQDNNTAKQNEGETEEAETKSPKEQSTDESKARQEQNQAQRQPSNSTQKKDAAPIRTKTILSSEYRIHPFSENKSAQYFDLTLQHGQAFYILELKYFPISYLSGIPNYNYGGLKKAPPSYRADTVRRPLADIMGLLGNRLLDAHIRVKRGMLVSIRDHLQRDAFNPQTRSAQEQINSYFKSAKALAGPNRNWSHVTVALMVGVGYRSVQSNRISTLSLE